VRSLSFKRTPSSLSSVDSFHRSTPFPVSCKTRILHDICWLGFVLNGFEKQFRIRCGWEGKDLNATDRFRGGLGKSGLSFDKRGSD
jgi:hypothetical protein